MAQVISPEQARTIEEKLHSLHRPRLADARLADAHFRFESWQEETRVIVRVTLSRPNKTLHYPMEAGVTLPEDFGGGDAKADAKAIETAMWLALDFLGHYIEEYLKSGREILLPLDWEAVPFGEGQVFARGWERNLALEEAGDRWLAGDHIDVPGSRAGRRARGPRTRRAGDE